MSRRGFSVVAVVLVILSCMFVAAIVVPGFMRACGCSGPEFRTIGWMRSINSSQQAYASSCAADGFARSFEDLAQPPLTGGTPFFPPGGPNVEEYVITMLIPAGAELPGVSCNGGRRATAYFAQAHPRTIDGHARFFATDQRGIVYESNQPIPQDMSGARPVQ